MKKLLIILFCLIHLTVFAQGWKDESLSTETNLEGIHFIDENHGWIVGDNGTVLKYYNDSWTEIDSDFLGNLTGVFFTDSVQGWIIGENGYILKYYNDTVSLVSSPASDHLRDIYMIDENTGWIVGNNKTILHFSENSWSVYPTDSFSSDVETLKNVQFIDSTFGIITGGIGFTILNYEDSIWKEDNNFTNTTRLSGLFIHDRENIFTSESGYTPGGNNWGNFINYNSITGNHHYIGSIGFSSPCDIDFSETKGWAIAGLNIYEYKGNKFEEYIYNNSGNSLNSICLVNDSIGWIVGNNGTILQYDSHYEINNDTIVENENFMIYPNPVYDLLFFVSDISLCKIEIYDISGKQVESIDIDHLDVFELNLRHLNTGLYILKILNCDSGFSVNTFIKD